MKILLSSDCHGNFKLLASKVTQLHTKNKFDCLLMNGNILNIDSASSIRQIADSQLILPLPTFFIDSTDMGGVFASLHPQGYKIGDNFQFLGTYGIREFNGLVIAYLNGVSNPKINQNSCQYRGKYYYQNDIDNLITEAKKYKIIDILLTNQWAQQYTSNNASKSKLISQLVYEISPRYHIGAGGGQFYRMDPFESQKGHATNFINVAPIQNGKPKDKYLYAIKIQQEITNLNLNPNPFLKQSIIQKNQQQPNIGKQYIEKSKYRNKQINTTKINSNTQIYFEGFITKTQNSQITQFMERWGNISTIQIFKDGHYKSGIVKFVDLQSTQICLKDTNRYTLHGSRIKFKINSKNNHIKNSQCWFCTGSTIFDDSLLLHKGISFYLAYDKGPISADHIQLVPYNHQQNYTNLKKQEILELQMIQKKLRNYYQINHQTLVFYSKYSNLSKNINHWVQYCIPYNSNESQLINKFQQINLKDRLNYKIISQKQIRNNYHTCIKIGSTTFYKQLNEKQRRDNLRQTIGLLFANNKASDWKNCQSIESEQKKQEIQKLKHKLYQIFKTD